MEKGSGEWRQDIIQCICIIIDVLNLTELLINDSVYNQKLEKHGCFIGEWLSAVPGAK